MKITTIVLSILFILCWSESATKRARAKGNRNNDGYSNKRLLYWFTWARNNIFLSNFQCIFLFTHSFHPWVTWSFVDSWSAMTVFFMFCICYVFRFFFVFLSLDFHVFLCFLSANIRTPFAIENFHYIENSYYNFSPNWRKRTI